MVSRHLRALDGPCNKSALLACARLLVCIILGGILVGMLSCSRDSSDRREGALRVISDEVGPLFLDNSTEIEHEFSVRNLSDTEPMKLEISKRACSCSTVAIPPGPVHPGATGVVKLAVSVPYRTGVSNAAVQLKTGLSDDPDLLLRLSVSTYRRISVRPAVFAVGELNPDSQKDIAFDVVLHQPAREADLPIRVQALGTRLSVEVLGETEEEQPEAHVTTAHCRATIHCPSLEDPDCPTGLVEETIRIQHGKHCRSQTIRWSLREVIAVEPRKLFVQCGNRQACRKTFHLCESQPFRIVSVRSEVPFITATVDSGESKTDHDVTVEVLGGARGNSSRATKALIDITTDHLEQRRVRLPVFVLWSDTAEP